MKIVLVGGLVSLLWLAAALLELRGADRNQTPKSRGHGERTRRAELRRQRERLLGAYADSALVRQVASYAADRLPECIRVEWDRIVAVHPDRTQEFLLADAGEPAISRERMVFLPGESRGTREEDYILMPQLVLAEALNRTLGDGYRITDLAQRTVSMTPEGQLCVEYTPARVELKIRQDRR